MSTLHHKIFVMIWVVIFLLVVDYVQVLHAYTSTSRSTSVAGGSLLSSRFHHHTRASYIHHVIHNTRPSENNRALLDASRRRRISSKGSSSSLSMSVEPFTSLPLSLQEDLPNLLGINPVEGTILFAVLYYIYGPTTLYEYARSAGQFAGKYGPILKQTAFDIFYEFRDYLEEDRDRDLLRKTGVDITQLPRRTSNVLERFQQSMQAISDLSESATASTNQGEMDSDDQDVVLALPSGKDRQSVERVDPAKKRRKSKKEVFAETSTNTTNDTMGATDINTQETLPLSGLPDDLNSTETTAANLPVNEDSADWLAEQEKMLLGGDVPAPSEDSTAGTWFNQQRPPSPIIPTAESIALSKFQQQLSGEWNSRVLRREEYTGSSLDTNPTSSFPAMSDTLNDDMNDAENFVFNDSFSESIPLSDIPEDLSITSPATVLMSPEAATTSTTSSTDPDQYREKGRVLLAQLDKDYNALRQQLVNFLENIPPEQSKKEDVRV